MDYRPPFWIMRWGTTTAHFSTSASTRRGIPFMIYSGYPKIDGETHGALHIQKPAIP